MDTYDEADDERARVAGLMEDNLDYRILTSVMPLCNEEGDLIGYGVGVGWVAEVLGDDGELHEYGNVMMITDVGAPIDALRRGLHHSYTATMANLG